MSNYTVRVVIDGAVGDKKTTTKPTTKKTSISKEDKMIINKGHTLIAGAGMVLSAGSVINGIVGNYTERTIRTRRINSGLKSAGYMMSLALSPFALVGIGLIEGKRTLDFNIANEKKNIKASYLRELSGNTTESGNRWRGVR